MRRLRAKMFVTAALGATVLFISQGCSKSENPPATPESSASASPSAVKPALPAPAKPHVAAEPLILAAGTPLKVRLTTAVSTKTHEPGEGFTANLEEPLVEHGRVVAPKGAEVEGKVVESDPGGRVKGRAKLALALTRLHLAGGKSLEIHTNSVEREAESTKRKDAAKIGIGSGVGAVVGAIAGGGKGAAIGAAAGAGAGSGVVLATRGDAAAFGAESVLNFRLRAAATIPVRN